MTSNPETSLQTATDLLTPWCEKLTKPEANRADVVVSRTNLLPAVQALRDAKWGFLSAITGLDHMKPAPAAAKPLDPAITAAKPETIAEPPPPLEVLYHFCHGAAVLTVRVQVPRLTPSVPSICALVPSATLYERELSELFGIEVLGTPDPKHLLLPDEWPNGVYPLRKDFAGLKPSSADTGKDSN